MTTRRTFISSLALLAAPALSPIQPARATSPLSDELTNLQNDYFAELELIDRQAREWEAQQRRQMRARAAYIGALK